MKYSKKDIITSLFLMTFIITFAITFTVFFKQLYYFDLSYLNIPERSGYDINVIKENYTILIHYQSIFYQGPLLFKDFIMSEGGRIHFEEVKVIFEVIQVLCAISFVGSIICIFQQSRKGEVRYLRLTSIVTILIPTVLGFLASLDFDRAFIIFHKIMFRNDFWIFDWYTDPIIRVLPEDFFMHCFFMIIFLVMIQVGICYFIYRKKKNKVLKELTN